MAESKEKGPAEETLRSEQEERTPGRMRPFEELERLYESIFPQGWLRDWPALERISPFFARTPAVDVIDGDDAVIVRAEVPGVRKEDLQVSISDDMLTLTGSTSHKEEERRENYFYRELRSGSFTRRLRLPAEVDATKVGAKLTDGVLEVTLPKVESAKHRPVDIKVG